MKSIAAALLATAIALPALAQDFSKVEVQATKLNDNTYMLTGAGGNLGLSVGEDAVFLIDDQYAPLTDRIVATIRRITPKPVRFVLNTHWHGDHTGGNALPVVTFGATMSFHLNGEELRALHMPRAHTDGDAIVLFTKSDVIHMGDIYFNGMYPFIDTSSGGTPEGVVAACDQVLAMAGDKTRIIPGHGPLSSKAELKAYRDMVATVSGRVKEMAAAGRKVEEMIAAGVTRDFDDKWGKGYIAPAKFVEMLAAGVAKSR